jgi:hypothetical protein
VNDIQQFINPGFWQVVQPAIEAQVVGGLKVLIKVLFFEYHPNQPFQPGAVLHDVTTCHGRPSPTRVNLAREQADGGSFARPIGSQQAEYLTPLHAEADTSNRLLVFEAAPEIFRHDHMGNIVHKLFFSRNVS